MCGASRAAVRGLIFLIQLYRHIISPLQPAVCRFVPTCSQYAIDALTEYGLIKGSWLVIARLVKCGPWHRGGWDPIPERRSELLNYWVGLDDTGVSWSCPSKLGEDESVAV
ncbi:membrane protein insertion efficiency factor YidD [Mycobacterium lepromatosis]|nr:membrane protein insertion efficiency factor YidD [Mycobacterium lepromatosis]